MRKKQFFKASLESLKSVRQFIFHIIAPKIEDRDTVDQIILAVDEAATNIIKHALKYDSLKEFMIDVETNSKKILIRLIDDGPPFNDKTVPLPDIEKNIKNKKRGGLGIYMMKQTMDEVNFSRKAGKNYTEMIKYCKQ